MKNKIYALTALAACIVLILTGFSGASGQLETNVTLSFSGAIQQTETKNYTYILSISGSNYQMVNGTTGQIYHQSTNATQIINTAIGHLTQNQTILFSYGTYNLNGSITLVNKDNIKLYFEKGAMVFISNDMNSPAIWLYSTNNCLIQNPTIDGNIANQIVATGSSGSSLREMGIYIDSGCSNNLVDGAHITKCGMMGVIIVGTASSPSINNGVTNSHISYCGWNGIGFNCDVKTGNIAGYALNNEVDHCGDVGISTYGIKTIIQNNTVRNITGSLGYNNANWGIAAEGGSEVTIINNTIFNVNMGVVLSVGVNCTIKKNVIYDWDTKNWAVPAILTCTRDSLISENQLLYKGNYPSEAGIYVQVGGEYLLERTNNVVSNNEIACGPNSYAVMIGSGAVNTTISGNAITAKLTIIDAGTETIIANNVIYNP